jgi:energy-coupling factor transporter ATP-binding protein EcfA2
MDTFTITVQRRAAADWPVVAEATATGDFLPVRAETTLRLPKPGDPTAQTAMPADPRAYGEALGRAVFRDDVRDAFAAALARCRGGLHVLLFVEDRGLQGLRWERLCGPLDGAWPILALDQRTPFSLYLPAATDRRFRSIGRLDLRALVVVACPPDVGKYRLRAFDAAAAVAGVRAALGDIPATVLADVPGADGPPTLDAVCNRVTREEYSLLHVICHGRYLPDEGKTVLFLAGPDGDTAPVDDETLVGRLGRLSGARGLPHFAFLCACESAAAGAADGAGGLAHRLVRELGMPAVLAMTEPVTVGTGLALAGAFYRGLHEHGQPDVALAEAWAGLAARPDVHVPALFGRLGGRPLFTDDLTGRSLTASETDRGLTRTLDLLRARAPVLVPEFRRHEVTIRRVLDTQAESLPEPERRAVESARDEVDAMCQRAIEVSFAGLALGHKEPLYDARCPFRGLYPFRVADQEFYFGREPLVEHLDGRLREHGFLAVLGPSGSGKSSVIMAGLLPRILRERETLRFLCLTPGGEPDALLDALLGQTLAPDLIVVDQFEELFTMCADPGRRRAFVERLLGAAARPMVVITMRADFWGECAAYPALKELMQAQQELVGAMTTAELRAAIDKQAGHVGLRFEADLSQTLVDEVAGEPGAMPLLQHALQEVWKQRHGRWLVAAEYRAFGGVRQAIAKTAEGVYHDLSGADRVRVRDIFVRLTRLGDDAADGGRGDTRQRVRLSELVPANGGDSDETKRLVKRLADEGARLLVSGVQEGEETVEVAHEALIRYWPRLRGWLDECRADLRVLAGVRVASAEWDKNRSDEGLLGHRGGRLAEAERQVAHPRIGLNQLESDYLSACRVRVEQLARDEQDRERRRRNLQLWVVKVSIGGFLVAAGLAGWAWALRTQAEGARNDANQARERAEREAAIGLLLPVEQSSVGLTAREVDAFVQLSALHRDQERIRKEYLGHALGQPARADRVANRIPFVVQALVGLDPDRRRWAEDVAVSHLDDPAVEVRVAAALLLAETDCADPARAERAAGILANALQTAGKSDGWAVGVLHSLCALCARLSDERALPLLRRGGLALVSWTEPSDRRLVLAKGWASGHFTPFGSSGAADLLTPHRAEALLGPSYDLLGRDVATVRERRWGDLYDIPRAEALGALGGRLSSDRAGAMADVLRSALGDLVAGRDYARERVGVYHALESLASRLDPVRAEQTTEVLARALVTGEEDQYSARVLAQTLGAVASRRDAGGAESLASALSRLVASKQPPSVQKRYALALGAVADHLPEDVAEGAVGPAADSLIGAMANAPDRYARWHLSLAIGWLADHLDPGRAEAAIGVLCDALKKTPSAEEKGDIARVLAVLAGRIPPAREAALGPVVDALSDCLAWDSRAGHKLDAVVSLGVVARRLHPDRALATVGPSADALLADYRAERTPADRRYLARALAAVAAALPPDRASAVIGPVADALRAEITQTSDSFDTGELAAALGPVASHERPPTRGARTILTAWSRVAWASFWEPVVPVLPGGLLPTRQGRGIHKDLVGDKRIVPLWHGLRESLARVDDLTDIVDLLKHPLCSGAGRTVLLRRAEQLTAVQPGSFRTQWLLVEWLRANRPDIDLSAPPPVD